MKSQSLTGIQKDKSFNKAINTRGRHAAVMLNLFQHLLAKQL